MERINYKDLNAKQKENYNFQKVSSIFADYGYWTIKLNDDWNGADFIAQKMDNSKFLKIQLKSRLSVDFKYKAKNISICFPYKDIWFLIDHDTLLAKFLPEIERTESWGAGKYSWKTLNQDKISFLNDYVLNKTTKP